MKRFVLIVAVLAACAVPLAALADWDPCCPCPNTKWVQLPDPTGWDVNCTTPKILADDFLCTETGWITDIHFWGSWKDDVVGQITNIHLSIHADVPACQSPTDYSMPGEELWSRDLDPATYSGIAIREFQTADQGWYDPNTGDWERHNHDVMWQVNVFLDRQDWFVQEGTDCAPVVYWLDIQVDVAGEVPCEGECPSPMPPQAVFGWKTSYEHWNDDAVWGDMGGDLVTNTAFWHELRDPFFTEDSLDMAFVITGIPIPEPSVFILGGIGLLALLRLRRRK